MRVILTNSYHGTTAELRGVTLGSPVSTRAWARAQRRLCGMRDCRCSHTEAHTIDGKLLRMRSWLMHESGHWSYAFER